MTPLQEYALYQVKDWNIHFENNKSRERDRCSFCCIPNKQDGLGYGTLLSLPNGPALYGAFVAVILVCSKQKQPRDGFLTENGLPGDCPLSARQLSVKTKVPEKLIQQMLDATSDPSIGWIKCPPSARQVPAECPRREEKERKEEKEVASLIFPLSGKFKGPDFRESWQKWLARRSGQKPPKCGFAALFTEQLAWLETLDEDTATETLGNSLRNGYTGLFETRQKQANGRPVQGHVKDIWEKELDAEIRRLTK